MDERGTNQCQVNYPAGCAKNADDQLEYLVDFGVGFLGVQLIFVGFLMMKGVIVKSLFIVKSTMRTLLILRQACDRDLLLLTKNGLQE